MEFIKMIYYVLMVLSLGSFLYSRKRIKGQLFLMGPLLACSIGVEVLVDIFQWLKGERYLFLFHIYQPIEYLLFALIYFYNTRNGLIRQLILLSLPIYFLGIGTYYFLHPEFFNTLKYLDFVLESFFLCPWAIFYLVELVNTGEIIDSITGVPLFWVSFAVLILYAGSILIMGFRYYFNLNDPLMGAKLLTIQHYLNLLFYMLLIIGFLWAPITRKPLSA